MSKFHIIRNHMSGLNCLLQLMIVSMKRLMVNLWKPNQHSPSLSCLSGKLLTRMNSRLKVKTLNLPSMCDVKWAQGKTPNLTSISDVKWAQGKTPNLPSIYNKWAQDKTPDLPSICYIKWAQGKTPNLPSICDIKWAQDKTPDLPSICDI